MACGGFSQEMFAADFAEAQKRFLSCCQSDMVNYMGLCDKGMILTGGCGDPNGKPQSDQMNHMQEIRAFGKNLYNGG